MDAELRGEIAPVDEARSVVVIPTYNERGNIDRLVASVLALPQGVHVIIVDDASPDGTGEAAADWSLREPRVQVIHRPGKLGLGSAHKAGFKRALQGDFDRILTMDADFSHDPSYVPALIATSQVYDLVIGSRYCPGGGTRNCGVFRRTLSRGANRLARLTLQLGTRDSTAGFRCYRRSLLSAIDMDLIVADGYSFLIEVLYRARLHGASVGEIPIIFKDRRAGVSKISKTEVFRAMGTLLRLTRLRSTEPGAPHA